MISSSQQDFQDYGNDAITCHQETEIATISTTFSSVSYLLCLKAIYYLERFSKLMSDCPYRMTRRHTDIVCAYFPYLDMTILKKKLILLLRRSRLLGRRASLRHLRHDLRLPRPRNELCRTFVRKLRQ